MDKTKKLIITMIVLVVSIVIIIVILLNINKKMLINIRNVIIIKPVLIKNI